MLFAKFRGPVTERQQAWELAGVALLLYAILRLVFGPLPQWLSYHNFADTRQLGFVPRAGDVLTNLAILFSGVWGALLVPAGDGDRRRPAGVPAAGDRGDPHGVRLGVLPLGSRQRRGWCGTGCRCRCC